MGVAGPMGMMGASSAGWGSMFGMGGGGNSTGGAWKSTKKEYTSLKEGVLSDEYLNNLLGMSSDLANRNWLGVGKTMGSQAADKQTMAVMNALSARGGGNIGDAIGLGAQGRVGSQLQGLLSGMQLKTNAMAQLQGLEMGRLSLLANLFATRSGVAGAEIGGQAQMGAAATKGQYDLMAALIGGGFGAAAGG